MKFMKAIALILAAAMLCVAMIIPASADSARREEQLKKYEDMRHSSIHVTITNYGYYSLKSSSLYIRKVTGVDADGNFILGGWEKVYGETGVGADTAEDVTLSGTAVCFAYSFDITWGTDFPYSSVFWNNPDKRVSDIDIDLAGSVRTADIKITVDGTAVVNETNCSSHSEWKPAA